MAGKSDDGDRDRPALPEEKPSEGAAGQASRRREGRPTDAQGVTPPFPAASQRRNPVALVMIVAFICLILACVAQLYLPSVQPSGQEDTHRRASGKKQDKQSKARPHHLNFPELYPDITSPRRSKCGAFWASLSDIPCHDDLFARTSDNSTFRPMGWDSMWSVPKICKPANCEGALKGVLKQLSAKCSATDEFILDGYDGMFGTKWLESGPVSAVETLVRRYNQLCRRPPKGDSDYEYCPIEMQERFGVFDGIYPSLNAINSFLRETDRKKVEQATRKRGRRGSSKHSYNYDFAVREQKYGPGVGETSCNWCVFDFLDRTLNAWAPGTILSPDSPDPVSLPEFIRRVRQAGQRCSPTEKWNKIYEYAIGRYQSRGLLPPDWDQALPSGDLPYLIHNGPSKGDKPVSDIYAELERLSSADVSDNWDGDRRVLENSKLCLDALGGLYKSAGCYINLSKETLTSMIPEDSKRLRSAYCSQECSDKINKWQPNANCGARSTSKARDFFLEYMAARRQRDTYCGIVGRRTNYWDGAQALLSMGKTDWAFTGRPDTTNLLAELGKALDELKTKPIPGKIGLAINQGDENALKDRKAKKEYRQWMKELGEGVCAGCFWDWLVGNDIATTMEYMYQAPSKAEYMSFVQDYHDTCVSRGAIWLGGEPYGDDPVIWRVKDSRGRIMRYIEGPKQGMDAGSVYGVNEENGEVLIYQEKRGNRPGLDILSMWHVMQAERGAEADESGRLTAWKDEEDERRAEADGGIWRRDWAGISYIGPKGGFGKKQEEQKEEL